MKRRIDPAAADTPKLVRLLEAWAADLRAAGMVEMADEKERLAVTYRRVLS